MGMCRGVCQSRHPTSRLHVLYEEPQVGLPDICPFELVLAGVVYSSQKVVELLDDARLMEHDQLLVYYVVAEDGFDCGLEELLLIDIVVSRRSSERGHLGNPQKISYHVFSAMLLQSVFLFFFFFLFYIFFSSFFPLSCLEQKRKKKDRKRKRTKKGVANISLTFKVTAGTIARRDFYLKDGIRGTFADQFYRLGARGKSLEALMMVLSQAVHGTWFAAEDLEDGHILGSQPATVMVTAGFMVFYSVNDGAMVGNGSLGEIR